MLVALMLLAFVHMATCAEESSVLLGPGETGSGFEPNATETKGELPYEANWVITEQPRCCSDCTFVAAGFKCKLKSCLQNCPWARSGAPVGSLPIF
ncbi:hypothetical protein L9F63_014842 [Diploptera punctata]|uniref:Uncharacterized protein n=1 Tax=Diploptera punctata TaxID=6984 RepID=A0AAD8A973_DIPPU|nr:hypothetical protein L9F63_014842 [Diploptera punctata]